MFADLTLPLRHPILRRAMFGLLSQLDALAPEAVKQVDAASRISASARTAPQLFSIQRRAQDRAPGVEARYGAGT